MCHVSGTMKSTLPCKLEQGVFSSFPNNMSESWADYSWIDWLIGWLVGWLIGWLVDWLIGWLVDWLIGWLVGWLVDWLVGWLVDLIYCNLICFNWRLFDGTHDICILHSVETLFTSNSFRNHQEFTSCDAIGLVADRDIPKGEELYHLYSEATRVHRPWLEMMHQKWKALESSVDGRNPANQLGCVKPCK